MFVYFNIFTEHWPDDTKISTIQTTPEILLIHNLQMQNKSNRGNVYVENVSID